MSPDNPAIIALLTDFGAGSPYVAQMKAVILSRVPTAQIVDITHGIPPQDIRQAAWVLADVLPAFDRPTVFVTVVDPGVGTDRAILAVACGPHVLIAPDNGALSRSIGDNQVYQLDAPRYWRETVSATFHGRDIMAPVAASIATGTPVASVGSVAKGYVLLPASRPESLAGGLRGRVEFIDSFGNLVTNIHRSELPADFEEQGQVRLHSGLTVPLVRSYGDSPAGTLVALFGSNQWLEIACVDENAAKSTNIALQAPVFAAVDNTPDDVGTQAKKP